MHVLWGRMQSTTQTETLVMVGDILGSKLNNTKAALEIYQSLLDEEPGSKMLLGKMLGLHELAKNWTAAVDTLTQLAELEEKNKTIAELQAKLAAAMNSSIENDVETKKTDKEIERKGTNTYRARESEQQRA